MTKTKGDNPDKVKNALALAKVYEYKAVEARVLAGEILYKHGPAKLTAGACKEWGVTDTNMASFLVEMYLTHRAQEVEQQGRSRPAEAVKGA